MYHVIIQIIDTKNDATLADVRASCSKLENIPRTLNTLLGLEPIRAVANGSPHAAVTIDGDRPPTTSKSAHTTLDNIRQLVNMARRNRTYVDPLDHMLKHSAVLNAHTSLLAYMTGLPETIPGLDALRTEAHRKWFAWHDRMISAGVMNDWLAVQATTVRVWQAEWLMARFEAYDFAGRQLRMKVQHHRAALLGHRITRETFDKHMVTAHEHLRKLQAL